MGGRHPEAARLRLGRPSSLDDVTEHFLRELGLPTAPPQEVPWREGEGFVWDDSTCTRAMAMNTPSHILRSAPVSPPCLPHTGPHSVH